MATRPIKLQDEALEDITSLEVHPASAAAMAGSLMEGAPAPDTPRVKPAPIPNRDDNKKAYLADAKKFGEADGKGKRAFTQFARTLVKGGAAKVLSPSPKSQDSSDMYKAFTESSSTAAGGLTTSEKASQSAQISKVRAFIRLGKTYEDGAEAIFDQALDVHKAIMADPVKNERVKLRSTYAAIYSIAVAQCKPETHGQPLDAKAMETLLLNDPVVIKERTGVDLLMDALDLVTSAQRGRAASAAREARDPVVHDLMANTLEAIRAMITDIDAKALADHDAFIEAMKAKKIAQAAKKAKDAEEKEAKKREEAAQKNVPVHGHAVTDDDDTGDNESEDEETEDETEGE